MRLPALKILVPDKPLQFRPWGGGGERWREKKKKRTNKSLKFDK